MLFPEQSSSIVQRFLERDMQETPFVPLPPEHAEPTGNLQAAWDYMDDYLFRYYNIPLPRTRQLESNATSATTTHTQLARCDTSATTVTAPVVDTGAVQNVTIDGRSDLPNRRVPG